MRDEEYLTNPGDGYVRAFRREGRFIQAAPGWLELGTGEPVLAFHVRGPRYVPRTASGYVLGTVCVRPDTGEMVGEHSESAAPRGRYPDATAPSAYLQSITRAAGAEVPAGAAAGDIIERRERYLVVALTHRGDESGVEMLTVERCAMGPCGRLLYDEPPHRSSLGAICEACRLTTEARVWRAVGPRPDDWEKHCRGCGTFTPRRPVESGAGIDYWCGEDGQCSRTIA